MNRHCLVHWLNEDRWDVLETNRLPAEHRHEGAVAMLPWGPKGEQFLGKVIKISSNLKSVEKAEQILSKEIKEKQSLVNTKRKSVATNRTGTASDAQVSKALGERKKLSSAQAQQKKDAALAKRLRTKAQEAAEQAEDSALLGDKVVRKLNFDKPAHQMSSKHDIMSDEEGSLSNDDDEDDCESTHFSDDDDGDGDDDDAAGSPALNDFKNPNTVAFLEHLLKTFTPTTVQHEMSSESKDFAKPLSDNKQKMVHLKKGFSLMVPKGVKAKLLVDVKSRKSPTFFLRRTLAEVYGSSQLAQMTAKGRLDGSIAISDSDLAAIYGFVTEYSDGDLDWNKFIETINKKCASLKSPNQMKTKSTKRKSVTVDSGDESSESRLPSSSKGKASSKLAKEKSAIESATKQPSAEGELGSSIPKRKCPSPRKSPGRLKNPASSGTPQKSPGHLKNPASSGTPQKSPGRLQNSVSSGTSQEPLLPRHSPWKVTQQTSDSQSSAAPMQAHYDYQYHQPSYYHPAQPQHYGWQGYPPSYNSYPAQPLPSHTYTSL